jgi:intracellular multiplication protein IcmO
MSSNKRLGRRAKRMAFYAQNRRKALIANMLKQMPENKANPFATSSSGVLTQMLVALMDVSSAGNDLHIGRAIAFAGALMRPLVYLRDMGELLLSEDVIREYFDLPFLERFVWDEEDAWNGGAKREQGYFNKRYGTAWDKIIRPLRAYMEALPGYDKSRLGSQEKKTLELHGHRTMQLAHLFGDIAHPSLLRVEGFGVSHP